MRTVGGFCVALVLAGCTAPFSESDVFKPLPVAHKATQVSQMQLGDEFKLTGDGGPLEERPYLQGRLPAKVTHEFIDIGDERIAASRIVPANPHANEPLIIMCGGNSSDRIMSGVYYAQKTLAYGELFAFDYPGYGDSTGKADTASLKALQAGMAAYIDAHGHGRPLVLWGHSLGGFICAELASRSREVDAIVLETTALNAKEAADKMKPWFLPFLTLKPVESLAAYDTARTLAGFKGPILELGAGRDGTLPIPLARSLAKALEARGLDLTYREYPEAQHGNAAFQDAFVKPGGDAQQFFARVRDINH